MRADGATLCRIGDVHRCLTTAFERLFRERMDDQIDHVRTGERLPGVAEPVVPGGRGERRRRECERTGRVPLSAPSKQLLEHTCKSLSIQPPEAVGET